MSKKYINIKKFNKVVKIINYNVERLETNNLKMEKGFKIILNKID